MIAHVETVHTAQRTFRALLAAMAYPGRITRIHDVPDVPAPLSPAIGAAARVLFDGDVSVWAGSSEAAAWLAAATGTRITQDAAAAQFAVTTSADVLPLARWNAGTAEDPETSATLLVHVASLTGGAPVQLTGPGIAGEIVIAPRGMAPGFWHEWMANSARYPLGADVFFFDMHAVIGLPRTVKGRLV
jgi:alpha-D-ribose 1-methylphosphonate 5-triphosphate synthase subunit PhnH